jgi:hypothetical protein
MALPALHVEGPNLVDSNGKITKLPGLAAFALFKRSLMTNGWDALVMPNLAEYRKIATDGGYDGPITLRVFRCAAEPNPFALDPWSYNFMDAAEFTRKCGELGFYVNWTGGDYQIVFPSVDPRKGEVNGLHGINQHNNMFCAALLGCSNAIWNTCNQPFKNGIDTGQVKPPPWAPPVQFSGNYDDTRNVADDLSCINLHTDRSTENGIQKWVGKAHESAPYLWAFNKPIFYDEPMGADEVVRDGARSNVPQYFGILGTAIGMVNAVYFHSTAGAFCNEYGPKTRACAVEFFKGVVGGLRI